MSAPTVASVPTGNTFDKYRSRNPVVRRLMAGFEQSLTALFERAQPGSVLDVGCGEGVLTHAWATALGERPVVGQPGFRTNGRKLRHFDFDLIAGILVGPGFDFGQRGTDARRRVFLGVLTIGFH